MLIYFTNNKKEMNNILQNLVLILTNTDISKCLRPTPVPLVRDSKFGAPSKRCRNIGVNHRDNRILQV